MIDIVQLSDTHFGTEQPQVMQSLVQELKASPPDTILLTGDITQRARPWQFKAAVAFLDALPGTRKLVIPGNHDIPLYNVFMRFFVPYLHYNAAFPAREYHARSQGVYFLGLDATDPWRHTRGHLDPAHLEATLIKARAAMREGDLLIVAAHQPLAVTMARDSKNVLIDAERTAHLFARYKVDMVLSGHVHYPLLSTVGRYFRTEHDYILSGAGTAISHRIRPGAPNSFNRIQIDHGQITLTRFDYNTDTQRFALHTVQRYRMGHKGWVMVELK